MEVRRGEGNVAQGWGLESAFVLLLFADLIPSKVWLRLRHPYPKVVELLIREVGSAVAADALCLLIEERQPTLGSGRQRCFVARLEAIIGRIAGQVGPFVAGDRFGDMLNSEVGSAKGTLECLSIAPNLPEPLYHRGMGGVSHLNRVDHWPLGLLFE